MLGAPTEPKATKFNVLIELIELIQFPSEN